MLAATSQLGYHEFLLGFFVSIHPVSWPSRVDPDSKGSPTRKKSQTDKSGDLGGHGMSPNLEMTWVPNNSRTAAIDCLAVCDVAPSC